MYPLHLHYEPHTVFVFILNVSCTFLLGDLTPETMATHFSWQLRPGNRERLDPQYITPHYIHSMAPDTRFLLIMRDPVERLGE